MAGAMMMAAGASAAAGWRVTVSGATVSENNPGVASVSITFNSDGTVDSNTYLGGTVQESASTDWVIPNSVASGSFEVKATLNSGSLTSGTTGSWLALSSNRTWSITIVTGTQSANLTIEVRYNGGASLDSGTYVLSATA